MYMHVYFLVIIYPLYITVREDAGAVSLEIFLNWPITQQFDVFISMINVDAIS